MPNTTDVEELDVLRDEKRSDAAQAGATDHIWIGGLYDPHASAILTAEIARLKGIIEQAHAALETLRPGSAQATMTEAEIARMWNATEKMLRAAW